MAVCPLSSPSIHSLTHLQFILPLLLLRKGQASRGGKKKTWHIKLGLGRNLVHGKFSQIYKDDPS